MNLVVIDFGFLYQAAYRHMSKISALVPPLMNEVVSCY